MDSLQERNYKDWHQLPSSIFINRGVSTLEKSKMTEKWHFVDVLAGESKTRL